jgi:hypothetical protein
MNQKQRTLVLLGGALVGAGALGWLAVGALQADRDKFELDAKESLLFPFDFERSVGLVVTARGETTEVARQEDAWSLISPVQGPADPNVVEGAIDRVAHLKRKALVDEKPADLKKYGLDHPRAQVTVRLAEGQVAHLELGDDSGFSGGQYARRDGKEAVLLVEGGNASLERTTLDLRDKRVLPFESQTVTGIDVRTPEGSYTLTRTGDLWRQTEPLSQRADLQTVIKVMRALQSIKAKRFAAESATDLAPFGLDNPSRQVKLTFTDHAEVTLTLGQGPAADGGLPEAFAKRSDSPIIYAVPLESAPELKQSAATLVDRTVLRFELAKVAALSFTTPSGETVLVQRKKLPLRDGGATEETWRELQPLQGDAKLWTLSGLLHNLATLRASEVFSDGKLDDKVTGLSKPRRKVALQDNAAQPLAELWVGSEAGDQVYVQAAGDDRIFKVDKVRLSELPDTGEQLLLGSPGRDGGGTGLPTPMPGLPTFTPKKP